jgi:predicted transcriptional regulator
MEFTEDQALIGLTADIVSAYVSNNPVRREELSALIGDVHAALKNTPTGAPEPEPEPQDPAVPIRSSVKPDYIVCLEDGKKFKSLRRHLNADHEMSPEEYREKWGLKRDYPMVAPEYAAQRSAMAKSLGLGRKRAEPAASPEEATPKPATRRRGRKAAAEAE